MKLHYHPLSPYSQKALVAIGEKKLEVEKVLVNITDPAARAEYEKIWPMGRIPVLIADDGRLIPESSIIIEYLDGKFDSGTRLIPKDPDGARVTRFQDRLLDSYAIEPMSTLLFEGRRPEGERVPRIIDKARSTLDKYYRALDHHLRGKEWLNEVGFSMADCAAAAAFFYLKRLHPFDAHANVAAYAARLAERPSVRAVRAEAEPWLAKAGM
jgi:glutathione S-transferase